MEDDGWDDIFDDFAKQCYAAKGKGAKIGKDVYFKTAEKLTDGMMKGLETSGIGKNDAPTNLLAAKFRQNIYAFSAAKTTAEYNAMAEALTDKNGKLLTFNQFRANVDKINVLYNETWLKTEYDTAVAKAQSSVEWDKFVAEKDKYPYLIYKTMEDDRVRPDHAILDGIKRPVDDSFWKTYYPPNGWNCRCYAIQDDSPHGVTPQSTTYAKQRKAGVAKYFKGNSGQNPVLFDEQHPYYIGKNGKKVQVDGAKDYGMPGMDTCLSRAKEFAPKAPKVFDQKDFDKWWSDNVKNNGVGGDNFQLTDRNGTQILFDADPKGRSVKFTKEHLSKDERHLPESSAINDTLKNADEIWSFSDKGKLTNSYIRYYSDKTVIMIAKEDHGIMKCITSFELDPKHFNGDLKKMESTFNNIRKGTLLHATKYWQ